jgi:hypothetical protein
VQAQINQAQSYMQAAKTVKESDPSYTGWAAAAAQYRKAEAAYRAAGALAQAAAAAEQALTLENALKIADQKAGQGAAAGQSPSAVPQAVPSAPAGQSYNACPPAAPPGPWQGTNAQYCATANCVERGSALYGMLCFPSSPNPVSNTKPQPDARQLGQLASKTCGSYERATEQCFADAKLNALLDARPDIRDYCEKQAAQPTNPSKLRDELRAKLGGDAPPRNRFLECVDDVWLNGSDHRSLREQLADELRQPDATPVPTGETFQVPDADGPRNACPQGQAMAPTSGAFGAWSCQPINVIYLARDKNAGALGNDADDGVASVAAFENRVNAVAAAAAAAAADEVGGGMSEQDGQICLAVAYADARSVLKGGAVNVPEKCKALANAALSQLAYYAGAHVDVTNVAIEEILAHYNNGANLGGPPPGMEGLTPFKQ